MTLKVYHDHQVLTQVELTPFEIEELHAKLTAALYLKVSQKNTP